MCVCARVRKCLCVDCYVNLLHYSYYTYTYIHTQTHTHSDAAAVHCPADASQLPLLAESDTKLVPGFMREGAGAEESKDCVYMCRWVCMCVCVCLGGRGGEKEIVTVCVCVGKAGKRERGRWVH